MTPVSYVCHLSSDFHYNQITDPCVTCVCCQAFIQSNIFKISEPGKQVLRTREYMGLKRPKPYLLYDCMQVWLSYCIKHLVCSEVVWSVYLFSDITMIKHFTFGNLHLLTFISGDEEKLCALPNWESLDWSRWWCNERWYSHTRVGVWGFPSAVLACRWVPNINLSWQNLISQSRAQLVSLNLNINLKLNLDLDLSLNLNFNLRFKLYPNTRHGYFVCSWICVFLYWWIVWKFAKKQTTEADSWQLMPWHELWRISLPVFLLSNLPSVEDSAWFDISFVTSWKPW